MQKFVIYLLRNHAIRNGQGFCVMALRSFLRESRRLRLARESEKYSFKKYKNWCKKLADVDVPNKIQSGEYSKDGGSDGFLRENGWYVVGGQLQLEWRWLECECQLR